MPEAPPPGGSAPTQHPPGASAKSERTPEEQVVAITERLARDLGWACSTLTEIHEKGPVAGTAKAVGGTLDFIVGPLAAADELAGAEHPLQRTVAALGLGAATATKYHVAHRLLVTSPAAGRWASVASGLKLGNSFGLLLTTFQISYGATRWADQALGATDWLVGKLPVDPELDAFDYPMTTIYEHLSGGVPMPAELRDRVEAGLEAQGRQWPGYEDLPVHLQLTLRERHAEELAALLDGVGGLATEVVEWLDVDAAGHQETGHLADPGEPLPDDEGAAAARDGDTVADRGPPGSAGEPKEREEQSAGTGRRADEASGPAHEEAPAPAHHEEAPAPAHDEAPAPAHHEAPAPAPEQRATSDPGDRAPLLQSPQDASASSEEAEAAVPEGYVSITVAVAEGARTYWVPGPSPIQGDAEQDPRGRGEEAGVEPLPDDPEPTAPDQVDDLHSDPSPSSASGEGRTEPISEPLPDQGGGEDPLPDAGDEDASPGAGGDEPIPDGGDEGSEAPPPDQQNP